MANPEVGGVNRTIEDGSAVVNSGSGANKQDPDPTSDTEQYVGVDMANQRAGSKKKACFQITSVSKRNAAEHDQDGNMDDPDSNDELDESRADEFSSSELVDSFNISRNSIQDLDPSVDDVVNTNINSATTVPASASTEEQLSNSNNVTSNANQANGNGPHRFKVVKVATEPIRKGRWTCRDFPSETAKSQTTPEGLRNQDSSKETVVHSGNSSAASSVHYIHGQDNSENPLSQVDESGKPAELGRKVSTNSLKDTSDACIDDQKDDRLGLDQLKDGLLEHTSESTEGDDG
ncbi:TSC22 domain family protein 2-like [Lytechinus pictus]|uniref:TSC22 domain family protein 2-like n=1 Tax=Lytechinus pictus TaxID=7653 RepID=UPI0030B9FE6A